MIPVLTQGKRMLESDVRAPPPPPATCKDLKGKRETASLLGNVVRLSFPGWRALESWEPSGKPGIPPELPRQSSIAPPIPALQ